MSTLRDFKGLYPSPLSIYGAQPLSELPSGVNPDGKSLDNGDHSESSRERVRFPWRAPIVGTSEDWLISGPVYYFPNNADEKRYAQELHERIRREFPELRIYKLWDRPVGPHAVPMFEVNTFTPLETGALFGFLTVWRGPLSVLIHPNTDDEYKDHAELGAWLGKPWPIDVSILKRGPHS